MAEHGALTGRYIDELSSLLVGSRRARARLCDELRCHLEEVLRAAGFEDAEGAILKQIGSPAEIAEAWAVRCGRQRARTRRRVALVASASAAASLLGAAQFAQGGQASGHCSTASTHRQPPIHPQAAGSTNCPR